MKTKKFFTIAFVFSFALLTVWQVAYTLTIANQDINDDWQQINVNGFGNPSNTGGPLFTFNNQQFPEVCYSR